MSQLNIIIFHIPEEPRIHVYIACKNIYAASPAVAIFPLVETSRLGDNTCSVTLPKRTLACRKLAQQLYRRCGKSCFIIAGTMRPLIFIGFLQYHSPLINAIFFLFHSCSNLDTMNFIINTRCFMRIIYCLTRLTPSSLHCTTIYVSHSA